MDMIPPTILRSIAAFVVLPASLLAQNPDTRQRMKDYLDSVPAIDTHDHLGPFEKLPGYQQTKEGRVMNLASIWQSSYLSWINPIPGWRSEDSFDDWWSRSKNAFDTVRATSVYRYTLPAIQDLYGLDFESISDGEARKLNQRIIENYRDQKWLYEVITEKANIEVMLNDPHWDPFDFKTHYGFTAQVLRLNPLFSGFHPSEFADKPDQNPWKDAEEHGVAIKTLDDYLNYLDQLFGRAKEAGLVGLKHTLAYSRTLSFDHASKGQAAEAFGKKRTDLTPGQIKAFEDFIMWRICELSAKHQLPFQIHTGHARIQGSNPMLLVDIIAANPKTQFVLFHGGFPWVGETGMIAARHKNVWIDSVWLPTLSYHTAKRAYHEWLDLLPADRIMWGADCNHAEGIYGATEMTRRVLAEVLAERVDRGELREEYARDIGRRILRENALAVFPGLKKKLWRHKQEKLGPE